MVQKATHDGGIDNSVALLLLGLGVVAFIMLSVAGMGTLQRGTERVMGAERPATAGAVDFAD